MRKTYTYIMQTEYFDKTWRDVDPLKMSNYLHWALREELRTETPRARDYHELLEMMEKGELFNNTRLVKKE